MNPMEAFCVLAVRRNGDSVIAMHMDLIDIAHIVLVIELRSLYWNPMINVLIQAVFAIYRPTDSICECLFSLIAHYQIINNELVDFFSCYWRLFFSVLVATLSTPDFPLAIHNRFTDIVGFIQVRLILSLLFERACNL